MSKIALLEDPDYALAESGLADTHFLLAFYGVTPAAQAVPQALAASEKAFRLAPESAETRVSLATVKGWCCWDFDATLALYRQAIEMNPGYSQGRAWYGSFLSALGRHEEAFTQHRQAIEFDPLCP